MRVLYFLNVHWAQLYEVINLVIAVDFYRCDNFVFCCIQENALTMLTFQGNRIVGGTSRNVESNIR